MKSFLLRLMPVVVLLMAMTGVMQAGPLPAINGSMGLDAVAPTIPGGDNLLTTPTISAFFYAYLGGAINDYTALDPDVPVLYSDATLVLADIASGGDFSLTNGTWGTFAPNRGVILVQDMHNLDVWLAGPYSGFPGRDTTDSSFYVSYTFNNGSVSGSGTLNSPAVPPGVPEPGTLLLLGAGLALLGCSRFRRRA